MKLSIFCSVSALAAVALMSACAEIENPYNPDNAGATITLDSPTGEKKEDTLFDTVGNAIRVQVMPHLAEYIDSFLIVVSGENARDIDTNFVYAFTPNAPDTIIFSYIPSSRGLKTIQLNVYKKQGRYESHVLHLRVAGRAATILSRPDSVIAAAEGSNISLAVTAAGSPPLTYTWRHNGVLLAGDTTPVLSIISAELPDAGTYTCLVDNDFGNPVSTGDIVLTLLADNAPLVTVSGDSILRVGDTCRLFFQAFNSEQHQPSRISVIQAPAGATWNNSSLVWIPELKDTGTHVVIIEAKNSAAPSSITLDTTTLAIQPAIVSDSNSAPVAVNDSITILEDKSGICHALANDNDPDGDGLSIVSVSEAMLGSASIFAGSMQYDSDPDANGTDSVKYTIIDSAGGKAEAMIYITIVPVNDAPVFVCGPNHMLNADEFSVTAPGWVTEISAGPANESEQTLAFSLSTARESFFAALPAIDAASGDLRYSVAPDAVGTVSVRAVLLDNGGTDNGGVDSAACTFTISIDPGADAPVVDSQTIDLSVLEDDSLELSTSALAISDRNNPEGPFTLDILDGDNYSHRDAWIIPAPDFNGALTVSVQVSDGEHASLPFELAVSVEPVNDTPQISSSPVTSAIEHQPYGYTPAASDKDGDTIVWSLSKKPAGMTIDAATGVISWTPGEGVSQLVDVTITAADNGQPAASDQQSFSISVTLVNDPPVIATSPVIQATEGIAYTYAPAVEDPEGDAITWSLTQKPEGMTIDASTGTISWTPAEGVQSADVKLTATDNGNPAQEVQQTYSITVVGVNDAPEIISTPVLEATEDMEYTYAPQARDAEGNTITWSLSASPTGMTIDETTGAISWTPPEGVTSADVTIRATDDGFPSGESEQGFTIEVLPVNDPPKINESQLEYEVDEGAVLEFSLTVSDPDGNAARWSLNPDNVGAVIRSESGIFTWQPAHSQAGNYTFSITAHDQNGGADTIVVSVTVTDVPLQFTISLTAESGGSISPSGAVTVEEGSSLTIESSPENWHHTSGWQVTQGSSYSALSDVSIQLTDIQQDANIVATFARNSWDEIFQVAIHDQLLIAPSSESLVLYTSNGTTIGRARYLNDAWTTNNDWYDTGFSDSIRHIVCGTSKFIAGTAFSSGVDPVNGAFSFFVFDGLTNQVPHISDSIASVHPATSFQAADMLATDAWAAGLYRENYMGSFDYIVTSDAAAYEMGATSGTYIQSIAQAPGGNVFGVTQMGQVFRSPMYPYSLDPPEKIYDFGAFSTSYQIETDQLNGSTLYGINGDGQVYKSTAGTTSNASFVYLEYLDFSGEKIQMHDAHHGWILGTDGIVRFTQNGWADNDYTQEALSNIIDITQAPNHNACYAIDNEGQVYSLRK